MKYLSDLHTHSIVSGHAYTTLFENIDYCAKKGIKILGTSEHAPAMPGAPHPWYFGNLKVLPREINGVILLRGSEVNIMDVQGNIDLKDYETKALDYMIASLHEPVFSPKSIEENTQAVLNAIDKNPLVSILGHLGNPAYALDYEAIVKKAKEKDIMIEINNSSIAGSSRVGSKDNCRKIAELCKEYGVKIILSSDAHVCFSICDFKGSLEVVNSVDFPEELIMNDPEKLIAHFKNKGKLQDL
ncbi:MAG: phosphatase [Clostridium sp.]|nr:phosphatase [Clostridium sp.]